MAIGNKKNKTPATENEEIKYVKTPIKKETNFERLTKEILKGLQGGNKGIPMGFNRLNRYVGIRKTMYYLIGGLTGLTII